MITKNWIINGLDLSSSNAQTNRIVLESVDKGVNLRTQIFNRENYHGSYTSKTLAEGRLITFKGKIFGDKDQRQDGLNTLNAVIKPVGLLENTEFFQISWKDYDEVSYKAQAKVYKMPDYQHSGCDPFISFTFELYIEDSTYKGFTDLDEVGGYGLFGGFTLPTLLPITSYGTVGDFSVVNAGNFQAPCKITIVGSIDNPRVDNLTNGRFYALQGVTTTSLVLDNTVRPLVVEDVGVNVSSYRATGSKMILLDPGTNQIVLTGDNYSDTSTLTITIEYNSTYISN